MPQSKASSPGEAVGTDKDKEAPKRQECNEVMKKGTKAAYPLFTFEQDDPGKNLTPRQEKQQWKEVVKKTIKRSRSGSKDNENSNKSWKWKCNYLEEDL